MALPNETTGHQTAAELNAANTDPTIKDISGLKVMQSAAGYYIGRDCTELDVDGSGYSLPNVPYSRESEYYFCEQAAQQALDTNQWVPR